jgi:hypothetical protein
MLHFTNIGPWGLVLASGSPVNELCTKKKGSEMTRQGFRSSFGSKSESRLYRDM